RGLGRLDRGFGRDHGRLGGFLGGLFFDADVGVGDDEDVIAGLVDVVLIAFGDVGLLDPPVVVLIALGDVVAGAPAVLFLDLDGVIEFFVVVDFDEDGVGAVFLGVFDPDFADGEAGIIVWNDDRRFFRFGGGIRRRFGRL